MAATTGRALASHLMIGAMRYQRLIWLAILAITALAGAENVRLYLRDGSDHLVREYQVLDDRVRFYSLERSEWEEIPLELVDLERTDKERARLNQEREQRAAEDRIERQAERQGRTELHRVPLEDGVYWVHGEQILPLAQAEPQIVGNTRRSILKVIAPIPVVAGKQTVEIPGAASKFTVRDPRPQFYFRLAKMERFGLVRVKPKKDARVVQDVTIVPVSNEVMEEQEEIEVFRQQLAPSVFKIWPVEPLEPGEYAIVQFTPGKVNTQVWDFAYRK
jgi:hypothetical protein